MANVKKVLLSSIIACAAFLPAYAAEEGQFGDCSAGKGAPCVSLSPIMEKDGVITVNPSHKNGGKVFDYFDVQLFEVNDSGQLQEIAHQQFFKLIGPVSFALPGTGNYRVQLKLYSKKDGKGNRKIYFSDYRGINYVAKEAPAPFTTPVPTPLPTPVPTPVATPVPTPVPTATPVVVVPKATPTPVVVVVVPTPTPVLQPPAVEAYWKVQALNRWNSVEFNDFPSGLRSFTGVAIGVKTPFGLSGDFGPGYSNISGNSIVGLNLNVEYTPIKYLKVQNQSLVGAFLADGRLTGYNIAKAMGQYPVSLPVGELVPAFGVEALAYPASPTTAHLTVGPFLQLGYSYKGFGIEAFYAYDRWGYSSTEASLAGGLNASYKF